MSEIKTVSGGVITYGGDNSIIDVKSLSVTIEPVQDLNGYDKPWAGGTGENLLYVNLQSITASGVTVTINDDESITLNGTATANAGVVVNASQLVRNIPTGSYYGKLFGDNLNGLSFQVYHDGSAIMTSSKGAFIIPDDSANNYVRIRFANASVFNNVTVRMMMVRGTTEPTEWKPYENICPISGHTEVDTKRTGKNLLNSALCVNRTSNGITTTHNADGSITFSGTASSTNRWWSPSDNMNVFIKAGTYTLSSSLSMQLYFHNSGYKSGTFTLTADDTIDNIRFVITNGTIYNTTVKPQLELGTTATDYEPYAGQTYTTDLGRTVYGGSLDVVSGVLTVDRVAITKKWGEYTAKQSVGANIRGRLNLDADLQCVDGDKSAISSVAPMNISWTQDSPHFYMNGGNNNRVIMFLPTDTSDDLDITVCYELATPQTYLLTEQQIEALIGINTLWSSAGDVELSYTESKIMPESVSINGKYLEAIIDGYLTLGTSGRRSLERELTTYSVGSADGENVKKSRFPSREIKINYVIQSDNEEELTNAVNQLNNILNQDEADFIFRDEPDKYFTGLALLDAEPKKYRHVVKGTWTLYCAYPFKRSVEPVMLISTKDASVSGNTATFVFDYEGTRPARPILRASFASAKSGGSYNEDGDCGFVAFLDAEEHIIQLGNPDIIDVDSANKNGTLINSEFSVLTGWTNNNISVADISDTFWDSGKGQIQSYAISSGTASLSKSITNAINFEFDIVHRMCVNNTSQVGKFEALAKNGSKTVVGFRINKTGNGTAGTVSYILNDKVVGTDSIDLSYYNTHFGYCNRTAVYTTQKYKQKVITYVKKRRRWRKVVKWVWKTRKVQKGWNYTQSNLNSGWTKDGGVITFSVGNLPDRTFKSSDVETTASTSIVFNFTGNFNTNALHSCAVISKKGVPFAEIPNVFTAGDVVEGDCNSANVVLYRDGSAEGHLEPQYGALGNDWEDFELKSGRNVIRAVWSDWVNANYKPTIEIIYNEVYL